MLFVVVGSIQTHAHFLWCHLIALIASGHGKNLCNLIFQQLPVVIFLT